MAAEQREGMLRAHHANHECDQCSSAICREQDPLHFHHDGCPYEYELEVVIKNIYNALGPQVCAEIKCQGCEVEIDHALVLCRKALNIPKGTYPA